MAINDILSKIAIWLHLKKSEERKQQDAIELRASNIRRLNDEVDLFLERMLALEAETRKLNEQCQAATGNSKEIYFSKLKLKLNDLQNAREKRTQLFQTLEREKLLLHNQEVLLHNLQNPADVQEIEEITDEKIELKAREAEAARAMGKLGRVSLEAEPATPQTAASVEAAPQATLDAEQQKMLDSLYPDGKAPEAERPKAEA